MARAVKKTAINFGLVNIPVSLFKATEASTTAFHQHHADCLGSIGHVKTCKVCETTVETADIVKGVDVDGTLVTVSDDEIAGLVDERGSEIEVCQFVNPDEIHALAFGDSYYCAPQAPANVEGYMLLRTAMKESGRVGIVQFVLRSRTHLGVLRIVGDTLTVTALHYPSEIREPVFTLLDKPVELKPAVVEMARNLVDAMSGLFDAEVYVDVYAQRVADLIAAKAEFGTVPAADGDEDQGDDEPVVSDLLAKLSAAVAAKAATV